VVKWVSGFYKSMRTLSFFFLILSHTLCAQSADILMNEGLLLEKEFKLDEALKKYDVVLKLQPNHVQGLIHASRMTSNLAGRMKDKEAKRDKLLVAETMARHAIELNPDSADAHFSLIITLGLHSEMASPKEKIKDAKLLKAEAEKIIEIDPSYALAYFVLGKWHYEVCKLSWFERTACNLFFDDFSEGVSMEESLKNFKKALALDPTQIIILYGYSSALHYLRKDEEAISILEKALTLPIREPDDAVRKEKCRELIREIKNN
jgi:tetratricopeptide (TPR) repeat protein